MESISRKRKLVLDIPNAHNKRMKINRSLALIDRDALQHLIDIITTDPLQDTSNNTEGVDYTLLKQRLSLLPSEILDHIVGQMDMKTLMSFLSCSKKTVIHYKQLLLKRAMPIYDALPVACTQGMSEERRPVYKYKKALSSINSKVLIGVAGQYWWQMPNPATNRYDHTDSLLSLIKLNPRVKHLPRALVRFFIHREYENPILRKLIKAVLCSMNNKYRLVELYIYTTLLKRISDRIYVDKIEP
jgi:hypothetical protein